MKNIKLFTIIFTVAILSCLISCDNGLKRKFNEDQILVSISVDIDGKKSSSARNIDVDFNKALEDFTFTASLVNKQDSAQKLQKSGNISDISQYLSFIPLSKGVWTITITGTNEDSGVTFSGSKEFTVSDNGNSFSVKLSMSGAETGNIQFTILSELDSKPTVRLTPLEKYFDSTYEGNADTTFNSNTENEIYYLLSSANDKFTYLIKGIAPGEYLLTVRNGQEIIYSDIATVYAGFTSTGEQSDGKTWLILDLQCGNQGDLRDRTIQFENGIAYLPGYGSVSSYPERAEPVRPGYLFTGWYDYPEAALYGGSPSIPIEQKYVTQLEQGYDNVYKVANRTLYAGWKKATIPEELMNKNLFLKKDTGDGTYIIKGNFNNKFEYSGYSVSDIPQSYVVAGDLIYWIDQPKLCFVDIETLEQDENKNEFYDMPENQIEIPALPEHEADTNKPMALYYDGGNILYALCLTEGGDGEAGIWNLVKITLPEYTGETPVAELIAIEEEDSRQTSSLYDYWIDDDNKRTIGSINFVINEGKMYVQSCFSAGQDILNRAQLAAFNIDVSSKAFNMAGGIKELSEIYQPTKYGVDSREYHEGEDLLSNVTVQDMYVDNTGIYLLIRDTSITWNGTGPQDTLVSTGAIVALDFDLNVIKTYGKAKPKKYFYSETDFVSGFSVAHSYDTSCFAEPYKLLAVYDRKFIFQERGIYCYLKDESDWKYYVKKFLNRVTVFDLDKECITYTQVTDTDIGEDSSIIDVYGEVGASCFMFDD